jgi:serine/threonine-protein kinase
MERIGRYEILQELGRGAMGAVYKALDPQIDRTVAIKVILTQGLSRYELDGYKQRFYREARAAGKMSHAGIVTIHDIAEDDAGHPYLVMEFVEGSTLDHLIEEKTAAGSRLPFEQALDIGIQVANALDYAHRRGVVHRDVKPANILLTTEGVAKIADFGIAKVSGVALTQTGSFLGTPAFMSPEQFSGGSIDARSDLFSLGAMLYWMFTGEHPFGGESLTTVSFRVVFTYPIPPTTANPALPPDVDTVLSRCLAKNPDERYASCRDLAADLDALKQGKPVAVTPLPPQERTVYNAPLVSATPLGGAHTVALPPEGASPTGTVAVPPTKPPSQATTVVDRTIAVTPAQRGQKPRAAPAWFRSRWGLAALAILLLLAFGWGGMRLLSGRKAPAQETGARPAAEPIRQPEPAPPLAEPEEEDSGPPPHAKASSKARQRSRTAPTGTLVVEVQHNFKDGTLEILMDGERLTTLSLRGEVRDLGVLSIASGTARRTVAIPAGQHVFRVRARANRGDYRDEEQIGGSFPAGSTRILLVEFGKGSGLKVVDRKLTLSWQ